jgi:putative membrane protein
MHILHGGQHLERATNFQAFISEWSFSFSVLICLGSLLALYFWGARRLLSRSNLKSTGKIKKWAFGGSLVALLVALISPVDVYSNDLFFVHMIQHLLLIMVAAPLIRMASPIAECLWGLPRSIRKPIVTMLSKKSPIRVFLHGITTPLVAWFLFAIVVWVWHVPEIYDMALKSSQLHDFEHLTMFFAGIVFWWPVLGSPVLFKQLVFPLRFLYLFLALMQNVILASILTYADKPIYRFYVDSPLHWGISKGADQQLGGVLMWLVGSMMFAGVTIVLIYMWLERDHRRMLKEQRVLLLRKEYFAHI